MIAIIPQYTLLNAKIITPDKILDPGFLTIAETKIGGVGAGTPVITEGPYLDLHGKYVAPGFIDLHIHGGGGYDTMDGTVEAFSRLAAFQPPGGTTSFLPTTLTSSIPVIYRTITACAQAIAEKPNGARILGLHLEGPYFAPSQAGAQDPRYLKNPDPEEYRAILDYAPIIKRVSVAPELPGGIELGSELKSRDIIGSIGHTEATFDEVISAIHAGYSMLTHIYSGMSTVKRVNAYRIAGAVEAGLFCDELMTEVIADGKHLPANLLKLIYKCKGPDRITLCTDATRATGFADGEYIAGNKAGGQKIIVEDGVAWMPDRKAFAGSVATTIQLLKTMVQCAEVPLEEAVRMLTINPATILKLDQELGSLQTGKIADLIIFNGSLEVEATIIEGVWVYDKNQLRKGVK